MFIAAGEVKRNAERAEEAAKNYQQNPSLILDKAEADLAAVTNEAKKLAGPEVINATLMIPLILIVAFIGLNVYMKNKKAATA
jgi:hypothetical protein